MPMPRRLLPLATLAGLMLAAGAAWAQAADPSVRITNRSPAAINEIFVSSAGVNTWGPDRLGDRTLAPDASHTIRLPAGQCVNDVRVIYDGGRAEERRRVNLCSVSDLVFP
jgi:hypothetical protein